MSVADVGISLKRRMVGVVQYEASVAAAVSPKVLKNVE
jgi:hypothetical protein